MSEKKIPWMLAAPIEPSAADHAWVGACNTRVSAWMSGWREFAGHSADVASGDGRVTDGTGLDMSCHDSSLIGVSDGLLARR